MKSLSEPTNIISSRIVSPRAFGYDGSRVNTPRSIAGILSCILIYSVLLPAASPAEAKWWKLFHHRKKDSTEDVQSQPPAVAPSASSLLGGPGSYVQQPQYVRYARSPASRSQTGSLQQQAVAPSVEPPPLPARPPIPDPPPVACPAPLGSGVAKPALAWRAKSLRQFSYNSSTAPAHSPATYLAAVNVSNYGASGTSSAAQLSYGAGAKSQGYCVSKTFAVRFDDVFMAVILACNRSGLTVRSMDSSQGTLEASLSDSRSTPPLLVQLSHDLLDTTNVTCSCLSTSTATKNAIGDLLFNMGAYLNKQVSRGSAAAARIPVPQAHACSATRAGCQSTMASGSGSVLNMEHQR